MQNNCTVAITLPISDTVSSTFTQRNLCFIFPHLRHGLYHIFINIHKPFMNFPFHIRFLQRSFIQSPTQLHKLLPAIRTYVQFSSISDTVWHNFTLPNSHCPPRFHLEFNAFRHCFTVSFSMITEPYPSRNHLIFSLQFHRKYIPLHTIRFIKAHSI